MSNNDAGKIIVKLIKQGISKVTLGHISKENNFPEMVYQTVNEELDKEKLSIMDIDLKIASREKPGELICV